MSDWTDAGKLNRKDARAWAHWWSVRGHDVRLASMGRGLFRCWLRINRRNDA